ncbi:HK97 family phage prohead protease [Suttonella ornithocola]|uniref:Phage prohead protease, HK97 family n=1 Tax=Suttonella ornithocola TaxID=279832 RepID=A0A380MSH2_9GAMM|nr:HK97 family phage prohead protease [Suttonella ornithocola]SUO95252.1 phage prohead protease, HK97 family [Suttonella ornithocola]
MKTKSINFKAEAVKDDGFFSGYCSVFDVVDSYGDAVRKGAYEETIKKWREKGKMPPILWQHDRAKVIGKWINLKEDEHGLYGEGQLFINDIALAKEAHALLKHGAIDGLSIGYSINKWSYDEDNEILELLALDLKEVSVVTFPANEESTITTVKSTLEKGELPSLKEFEKFLREAGFSKSQATAIASHGLRKLLGEPVDNAVVAALNILKSERT